MTMTPPTLELVYRTLIDPADWDRIVARIEREHEEIDQEEAARILNEALGFLKYAAENPGESSVPSKKVDIGWHTLILYTRTYHELCERIAGRYLHHEPSDMPGQNHQEMCPSETVATMVALGFQVDLELWPERSGANCGGGRPECRCGT